jgi:hypothetical protein
MVLLLYAFIVILPNPISLYVNDINLLEAYLTSKKLSLIGIGKRVLS